MDKRTTIYIRLSDAVGTLDEPSSGLRRIVEDRGDVMIATFTDDARIEGKGKNAAWRRMLASLHEIDQIVLNDPGDLPGKSVKNLLSVLATLTAHGVSLSVPGQGIDTGTGSTAILSLAAAYRSAKLSQAIRRGQNRARAKGKRIGRPPIPQIVRRRILTELSNGGGVRPTARKYNVSPASVVSISRSLGANPDRQAA